MRPTTAPFDPNGVRYPDDELPAEGFRDSGIQCSTGTPAGGSIPQSPNPLIPAQTDHHATGFHQLVATELASARALWPPMTDLGESAEVIREELREFEAEVCKKAQHRDRGRMLEELVQAAAMCQRAAEDLGFCGTGLKPVSGSPGFQPGAFRFPDLVAARYPRMYRHIPDKAFTSHGALARLRATCRAYADYVDANLYRPATAWPYELLLDELVALGALCWCCAVALHLTLNPSIPQSPNPSSLNPCSAEPT